MAALAVAAGPALADGGAHAALKGYTYCGKSSLGFTDAKVYGRHYGCKKSKRLFRAWNAKLKHATCNKANNKCKVSNVKKFRCVYGGSEELLRLRCTKGNKRVRAYWGG